jgi:flagellar motor switch protein FliN
MTTDPDFGAAAAEANATAAAEAAAQVLPAVEPLTAGPAQPGSPHVTAAFAGAAVADLEAPVPGRVAILVGQDLVTALENSPLGGLDLHAAIHPALEAAAARLGSRPRNARTVELEELVPELGGEFTTVPLIGLGIDAAVLMTADALSGAREPVLESEAGGLDTPPPSGSTTGPAPVPAFTAPLEEPTRPLAAVPGQRGLELLHGVDMEVTVELGRTRMTVRDLLALSPGAVLELDRAAGSPADLLVNGRLIARGEVVVVDEDFGLRITEILDDAAAV